MYPVRNSVKAIIIEDGKLLVIRKSDSDGYYYILPGGGQEKDETFIETVKRECMEELGA
ncbi:MAG: NUDIX domain-containing protein [Spirochaetales bacterium]|nr:NUDIX domain-containing protein [Spirochaetales bacterium]